MGNTCEVDWKIVLAWALCIASIAGPIAIGVLMGDIR